MSAIVAEMSAASARAPETVLRLIAKGWNFLSANEGLFDPTAPECEARMPRARGQGVIGAAPCKLGNIGQGGSEARLDRFYAIVRSWTLLQWRVQCGSAILH